jgi:hypothetical protein
MYILLKIIFINVFDIIYCFIIVVYIKKKSIYFSVKNEFCIIFVLYDTIVEYKSHFKIDINLNKL